MPVFRVPKLSHHKASGNAVVRLGGKDFYLGPWRSKAARGEYDRLVTEWLIGGRVTDKRALQCTYESPLRKTTVESDRFRFDPYALYFGQRAWYAIGFHHGHSEVHTLKPARLLQCKSIDKPYLISDDFSLEKHFGQAWRMMPSVTLHDIHLHFDAKMAETVADTHWHDSQNETFNDDGSLDIYFRVDGLEELIWWILSYGPHCRVIEPAELRTRIAELHTKAATLY